MKRAMLAASVIATFAGSQAFAQTVGISPSETIIVEPEQRTVIKQYVVKEHVAPVIVKEGIRIGARLPEEVELRTAPSSWGPRLSRYSYVYSDDHVYLVEPSDRMVIQEIE
jgi:hypothetical protein